MPSNQSQGMSYARLGDDIPAVRLPPPKGVRTIRDALTWVSTDESDSKTNTLQLDEQDIKFVPEGEWERYSRKSKTCIFFALGPRKTAWDLLMLGLILYSCVTVPFRIGMGADAVGYFAVFEVFVTLIFCTDLALNFSTAYQDGDTFVVDRSMIARNYFNGWFTIDLLSSFPLELVELAMPLVAGLMAGAFGSAPEPADTDLGDADFGDGLRLFRALRLVRLLRLLRLLKIQKYVSMLEEKVDVNLQVLQLVKMVIGLLYLMHVLGCFWFFLGSNPATPDTATWLTEYDGGSGLEKPTDIQYLYSIYWALMTLTTVGYGDITPANDVERSYALMSLLVGALVFGYILSSVGDLMGNIDQNAVAVDDKLTEVKNLLRWHRVPRDLSNRINHFFEFFYSRIAPLDEEGVIEKLPPMLRHEMHQHLLRRSVVSRVAMLNVVRDNEMLLQAYFALKPLMREPKEVVREAYAPPDSVFFLSRGAVEAIGYTNEDPASASSLPLVFYDTRNQGDVIGESSIMHKRGFEKFVSKMRSEIFVLGVDDLTQLLTLAPESTRDAIAIFIVQAFDKHQRSRMLALKMAKIRISNTVISMIETPERHEPFSQEELSAMRLSRTALVLQAWFVRTKHLRFVHDTVTTLDATLPAVYGTKTKPEPPAPGAAKPTSILTPRDAVSGARRPSVGAPASAPPRAGAPASASAGVARPAHAASAGPLNGDALNAALLATERRLEKSVGRAIGDQMTGLKEAVGTLVREELARQLANLREAQFSV